MTFWDELYDSDRVGQAGITNRAAMASLELIIVGELEGSRFTPQEAWEEKKRLNQKAKEYLARELTPAARRTLEIP